MRLSTARVFYTTLCKDVAIICHIFIRSDMYSNNNTHNATVALHACKATVVLCVLLCEYIHTYNMRWRHDGDTLEGIREADI